LPSVSTTGRVAALYFSLLPLLFALFFPLIPIVLAPTPFLSSSQGLALQTGRIFPLQIACIFSEQDTGTGCDRNSLSGAAAKSVALTGTSVQIGFVMRVAENG
jgi:hypothetical protein